MSKASNIIKQLQELITEYGDLDLMYFDYERGRFCDIDEIKTYNGNVTYMGKSSFCVN